MFYGTTIYQTNIQQEGDDDNEDVLDNDLKLDDLEDGISGVVCDGCEACDEDVESPPQRRYQLRPR